MDKSLSKLRLVMDRKAWRAAVHEVEESQIRLSDWTKLVLLLGCWLIPSWEWDILSKKKVQGAHCHVVPWVLWSLVNLFSYYLSECIFLYSQFLLVLCRSNWKKCFFLFHPFRNGGSVAFDFTVDCISFSVLYYIYFCSYLYSLLFYIHKVRGEVTDLFLL